MAETKAINIKTAIISFFKYFGIILIISNLPGFSKNQAGLVRVTKTKIKTFYTIKDEMPTYVAPARDSQGNVIEDIVIPDEVEPKKRGKKSDDEMPF